jgi:glutamyl-tRNA synthetase
MTATPPRTRFAPSPTGLIHLGNARTALFSFLLARAQRGRFLLRLEDTDAVRGEERFALALQDDLRWLGLQWDEGPGCEGGHGPYAQSERGHIYEGYFETLRDQGAAYPCFCSEHELKLMRKTQLAAGRPPRYDGRCRRLGAAEVAGRFANGEPATLRFHVADGRVIEFDDGVRGSQRFVSDEIGDFVIRRSDGSPAFFFSNAIDDATMAITLVVRGEDHLANTPRQILLLEALSLPIPQYAHIALVVGDDGAPLSKRNGSQTVEELRRAGYMPEAIVNYLARLGHNYEDNSFLSIDELARQFDMAKLSRAPARFDSHQLLHWQREAVARSDDESLWHWMNSIEIFGSTVGKLVPESLAIPFVRAVRENVTMPHDAYTWAGSLFSDSGIYDHDARQAIVEAGAGFFGHAVALLAPGAEDFAAYSKALATAAGVKGRNLFMPLRAAITGEVAPQLENRWHDGPALAAIWNLLGRERIKRRLELARAMCQA